MKNENFTNLLFLVFVCVGLVVGILNALFNKDEIKSYENRTAYQMPSLNWSKIYDKTFQDEMELFLADQIPLSDQMKKGYNYIDNFLSNKFADYVFKLNCKNRYITLRRNLNSFGCDKHLVYSTSYLGSIKEKIDKKIKNINNVIKKTNAEIFIYYIERATDINFETNEKSDIYNYIHQNIKTDQIFKFEINDFEDYNEYFYKTDHHWNHKGSYKAYSDLVRILTEDKPLLHQEEKCLTDDFSGSIAIRSGTEKFYKERFCAYSFNYPDYKIMINGKDGKYGDEEQHFANPNYPISYSGFYGQDYGEVIFVNPNLKKENILIIGESFDNAIIKLIASHFHKTFAVDLRNYQREKGKQFIFGDYLKKNDISKILLIGNRDFYYMEEFILEG